MTEATDDPRAELAQIAASLRAYLEWQVDTGAHGIPRGHRPATRAAEAPSSPAVAPQPVAAPIAPALKASAKS